ncbi:uncharacterized protein LOC131951045 [Physella acuta]|uniref:uncharacterized protein LOC131951045 n=1 Tax=Physella acuta TaxID=109671 RepID=UPI0027DDCF8D|nr:uncharacterized protein LOC131951045 [Physella acuta]
MVIQRGTSQPLTKDVLYIGSAVPLVTSEGLEAIQQPLSSRYPVENDDHIEGIKSSLAILPSGIQLQYKNDPSNVVLFPFSALTMCAAVRCVRTSNAATNETHARFVSLSSPEAGGLNSDRPAIFTAITRRTKGRQVLECHGFITMTPKDAMDLVQYTSIMDKRSKQPGFSSEVSGVNSSTYEVSKGDISFQAETASLPEFPIQLVPGEPMAQNTSPAFYKEPPASGYFYSTKNAQVKKYSLHRYANGGGDDASSIAPPVMETLDRRSGYAGSHYSTGAAPMRRPIMVPVRPMFAPPPPTFMRPVLLPPPRPASMYAYPRPRFFSPPPPPVVRPLPVFVPPPVYYDNNFRSSHRHHSFSSRSSSSSPETSHISGHAPRRHRDHSSDSGSRPQTPPTDYDSPRGPRVSRREEFVQRQNGHIPVPMHSQSFYMVPPYGYYGAVQTLDRNRSAPPYNDKTGTKKKDKKSKKNKKEKKTKSKKRGTNGVNDVSTDSLAGSEAGAENRQPRDFRRLENQFKHERAFSKSLTEETRKSVRGDAAHDAYTLNTTGVDNEFPMY